MADDQLQPGVIVQGARHGQAHNVQRRLVVPTPAKRCEPEADLRREAVIIGLTHLRQRHAGVDIDRHVERFRALQQRRKSGVVEEVASDRSADQRTAEAQVSDRSLQLVRGALRDAHRQMSKGREAIGVPGDFARQVVVEVARKCQRLVAVQHVGARAEVIARLGQHLHRDTRSIHVGEAAGAEIDDLFRGHAHGGWQRRIITDAGLTRAGDTIAERGEGEVLLQGDDAYVGHGVCLSLRSSATMS